MAKAPFPPLPPTSPRITIGGVSVAADVAGIVDDTPDATVDAPTDAAPPADASTDAALPADASTDAALPADDTTPLVALVKEEQTVPVAAGWAVRLAAEQAAGQAMVVNSQGRNLAEQRAGAGMIAINKTREEIFAKMIGNSGE